MSKEELNETPKFSDPLAEVSMKNDLFVIPKKERGKKLFIDAVQKCPVCGAENFSSYLAHLDDKHRKDSWTKLLKILHEKIDQLGDICSDIYLIHYHMLFICLIKYST